jgi:hypothetical protein
MPTCKMPLPGNVACPHEAIYVVLSPLATGKTARRYVCLAHLVAAIDHDMYQRSGVRVAMAVFADDAGPGDWVER